MPVSAKPLPAPGLYADRYDLIDAWRGLAALGVCVHHVTGLTIGGPSVMLFFVISGYCIAASADACQRKGWGFKGFMWRRVRRIYPPYLLAIAFWIATRLVKWRLLHGANDLDRPWTEWVQNITLTQWLSLLWHPISYAANNTTLFVASFWSLCYEEQFYLIMGLMVLLAGIVRMSVLWMSSLLLVIGLAWNVLFPSTSFGLFIEYWSLFGIGVVTFHRLCRIQSGSLRRWIDAGLFLLVVAGAYGRFFAGINWPEPDKPHEEVRYAHGEIAMAACFALVLITLRPFSERIAGLRAFKPLAALGHITFSLYLIHQFNLNLMQTIAAAVLRPINHLPRPVLDPDSERWSWPMHWLVPWFLLQIAGHIVLASIFWYFCERPFLNKSLIPPTRAASPESPKS